MRSRAFLPLLLTGGALADSLHPLVTLEDIYPSNEVELKVSAMAFRGDDLFVTVFSPNRQDKAPFLKGEIFRIPEITTKKDRSGIKAERVMGDLYEPTAIAVHNGKIYVGEKDKISRLEDRNGDGKYDASEKVILIDGISQPNFHTYTVGFGVVEKDGKNYLAGNLTTSIKLGGSRAFNVTVNPKTHRGSTFMLGPITGEEKPEDTDISYVAGGYRTPNGFGVGADGAMIVVDNQGVFNPSNEFIRITPGGFYGHFLMQRDDSNIAAFQPKEADSVKGGSKYQSPPTVHMPQGAVARSPSQPVLLKDLPEAVAAYEGQYLVGDVTMGRVSRVFTEEVDGIWQGAVFKHSGGHDAKGVTGFTAGPNRIVQGPDKRFYIGHIGAGGLWEFLGEPKKPWWGLQRMTFKSADQIDPKFNEIVAVRDVPGGLELEFFRPLDRVIAVELPEVEQWTYVPTNGYGGRPFGKEALAVKAVTHSGDMRRVRLSIPGIRDNSPPFIKQKGYSNENVGWVVHLKLPKQGLYADEAWYTSVRHQREQGETVLPTVANADSDPKEVAEGIFSSICAACHSTDGSRIVGPSLKGILGRTQKVIRDGKPVDVTVDEAYLHRALTDPLHEYPEGYAPAMPALNLPDKDRKALVDWMKGL
ncbi:cytochrome c [Haloferula helveola]|uniref:Cytochrome c n=1 Tax=Haloferula helveola TaxID=490095 RepID=A0ABN6GZQ0_9BACT|nr:cytochrome c [Haloferula helveola]